MTIDTSKYREMDRAHVWHPYTKRSAVEKDSFPVIVRGKGVYLYDSEGRRYLDAISSWWACNLGHGHPRIVAAIVRQARELQHSILGNLSHPRAVELAARLAGLFPSPGRRILFAGDGASAVEAALKIALQYWSNTGHRERNKFASLREGYHGDTLGAVSVGRIESFHKAFDPVLFPVYRAESPCCGTCACGLKPETCALECLGSMRRIIEEHANELAAVIVEPLCQCAGGMRIYSPRYPSKLSELCAERGILLIADEIAVGMGRTGKMFAFEHAGIDPDIVCLGKGLSAGYLPISATVVKKRIYETFADTPQDRTFCHGHTFAGNPIAAAAALETLCVYEEEGIVQGSADTGRVLERELSDMRNLPIVADVRCLGMIGAVELKNTSDGTPGSEAAQRIRQALLDVNILVRPLGNVVYLMPPLVTPEDTLVDAVKALKAALQTA